MVQSEFYPIGIVSLRCVMAILRSCCLRTAQRWLVEAMDVNTVLLKGDVEFVVSLPDEAKICAEVLFLLSVQM